MSWGVFLPNSTELRTTPPPLFPHTKIEWVPEGKRVGGTLKKWALGNTPLLLEWRGEGERHHRHALLFEHRQLAVFRA